ncbi:MAG: oxidoreductase [Candidatus Planktophila sp.]|tara:strand:- start:6251 stop:7165 length:915 start_codon:yes stop_codon:yes gene_type:complete
MASATTVPRGWNADNLGDLTGKLFLITGGTSGIGKVTARALARAGARVTITARNQIKGANTVAELGSDLVDFKLLDLADLSSVRSFAKSVNTDFDVLILNAGVMGTPFSLTKDNFELQMGTNHLGHFALAGLLRSQIKERIVAVSSQAHRAARISNFTADDLRDKALGIGAYNPWPAYALSKLANLLFIHELERRQLRSNWNLEVIAAHPGYADTNLITGASVQDRAGALANALFAQSAERGALPTLCAATFPGLYGASYIGPDGFMEMRGFPKITRAAAIAYDQRLAGDLWSVSEELTGVIWR